MCLRRLFTEALLAENTRKLSHSAFHQPSVFLDPWLPDFSFLFLSILVEGAPFILLGTIISGFIDVYLPSGAIDRLLPRNRGLAVLMSGLLGIIFPVCECAVVPVIRRLVKKGLPPACAITYMLAAPIVNPVTFLSTYSAFKKIPLEMAGVTCCRRAPPQEIMTK